MTSIFNFLGESIHFVLKNKIFITVALFLVYLLCFDEYNLKTRYSVAQTNKKLTEQKESFINLLKLAKQDKIDLEMNYEKFAREKYKMSRADEDIFIIEPQKLKEK
ncbi:MAG: septum formation initiator family protein [Saprospiraceae bacterium]